MPRGEQCEVGVLAEVGQIASASNKRAAVVCVLGAKGARSCVAGIVLLYKAGSVKSEVLQEKHFLTCQAWCTNLGNRTCTVGVSVQLEGKPTALPQQWWGECQMDTQ